MCVCHGDDFTIVGEEEELKWIADKMKTWFDIEVRAILGPDQKDDKEVVILGRVVRWRDWGIEFEADPWHRQVLADRFGFTKESAAGAHNGDKERKEDARDEIKMGKQQAKEFREMVARMDYLAQDAPDLQYPSKEVSREMARPRRGG